MTALHRCLTSVAVLLLSSTAVADETESSIESYASIHLISDYRFFGGSSSAGDPALQASVFFEHSSGWYAGVFSSSVDFDDGSSAHYEFDTYIGRSFIHGDWAYTGELVYISYDEDVPGPTYDFWQAKLAVRRSLVTPSGETWIELSLAHTPEASYATGQQTEYRLEASYALPHSYRLIANFGFGDHAELPDRAYWTAGLEKDWQQLTFGVYWVGTDQSRVECYDTDWCSESVVASVTLRSW